MMIQGTLSGIFNAQIAYAEGDRNHPFLEEVVSLLCNFFESTGNWRSALYMWHHFLGIQERTFGEVKKEMTTTYKKLATIYSQVGNPTSAAEYFAKAQELMTKSLKDATEKGAPADKIKELREEQAYVFFQQYLVANQAEDIEKSIDFISKQTEC